MLGLEVLVDEAGQVERRRQAGGAVGLQDDLRIGERRAVHEGLAVLEDALMLPLDEEFLVAVGGGQGIGGRDAGDLRRVLPRIDRNTGVLGKGVLVWVEY